MAEPPVESRQNPNDLPKIDRSIIDTYVSGVDATIVDVADEFFNNHQDLQAALLLGFSRLGEQASQEIYIGAGATAAMLSYASRRNGVSPPDKISKDDIKAAIDSQKSSVGGSTDAIKELFDTDPELFLGLTIVAHKMKVQPGNLLQGGALMRDIYKHTIDKT